MKKLLLSLLLIFSIDVFANDYCALYFQDKSKVSLHVLQNARSDTKVLVLNTPSYLNETINGINAKPYFKGYEDVICNNKRVGEIRTYNFSNVDMTGFLFEIRANNAFVSTPIN